MAAFDEPDLLEEDFPVTTKRTTVMSDDREELTIKPLCFKRSWPS